ncbi:MAG: hypothetical protein JSV86_05430 [Gemmatimonadota bacterium]|nr:MAG: hypothetical protein JSV86_05430 [Gemmatimonadota bacterium]
MALNTITKMRLPNGMEIALVDWTDKPLYSTIDFLTGFTREDNYLFTYVAGDQVPGVGPAAVTRRVADESDTNLATPGAMASTEEMLIYAIKPEVFELQVDQGAPPDLGTAAPALIGMPIPSVVNIAMLNLRLLLQLEISQKLYAQAGFGYFNTGFGPWAGAGVVTAPAAATAGARTYGNPGSPEQGAVRSFVIPHHIGGQEKYRIILVNTLGTAINFGDREEAPIDVANAQRLMRIRIYLDGLYKRPVS